MRVRALFLVEVLAALALLATACGGGEAGSTPTPTVAPRTQHAADLTAEEAIQRVLEMLEAAPGEYRPNPSTATATRIKDCETVDVHRWEGSQWGGTPNNPSERPAWLVKVRGEFINPFRSDEATAPPRNMDSGTG